MRKGFIEKVYLRCALRDYLDLKWLKGEGTPGGWKGQGEI